MPPSILPAGAQGGTSACSTGAALSFVSCIRSFGGVVRPSRGRAGRLRWAAVLCQRPNEPNGTADRPRQARHRMKLGGPFSGVA